MNNQDRNQWRFFILKSDSENAARAEERFLLRLPTNGEEIELFRATVRPAAVASPTK